MQAPPRRIAAIVLPQLACELVKQKGSVSPSGKAPFAVIVEPDAQRSARAPVPTTAVLDMVDDQARRFGVRAGQKVVEAAALVAHLAIHRVTFGEVDAALGRVAEVALGLGTTAAIQLGEKADTQERNPWGNGPFDTVWLDITGAAHLVGGEDALCEELRERVAALGHRARIAIADGPRLAQALARWGLHATDGSTTHWLAPCGLGAKALAPLPVQALPISPDVASFLVRLGVLRIGDLGRLPRSAVAARLGHRTHEVMELLAGRDAMPLVPFQPPKVLEEETHFEEGVENAESLLFVLRGMTSRIAARLNARGEACGRLDVIISYDASIAKLRLAEALAGRSLLETGNGQWAPTVPHSPEYLRFHVDLPAPLKDANDLLRSLKAKLERTELLAPALGLKLIVSHIASARQVQLDLSRNKAIDPDSLPALLAELSAEIGPDRVGILQVVDAHCPEAQSKLTPVPDEGSLAKSSKDTSPLPLVGQTSSPLEEPTRLLAKPVSLGRIGRGAIVSVDRHLYAIDRMRFVMRLDSVGWWSPSPASRDYFRVWLTSGSPSGKPAQQGANRNLCGEAWVYVDRATGEGFLQGWCE